VLRFHSVREKEIEILLLAPGASSGAVGCTRTGALVAAKSAEVREL
jgi:hypothetical protein